MMTKANYQPVDKLRVVVRLTHHPSHSTLLMILRMILSSSKENYPEWNRGNTEQRFKTNSLALSKYQNWSKTDLIKEIEPFDFTQGSILSEVEWIERLKKRKKYGLVWEEKIKV